MQTKKQGFTLIELLVVIVIIGILATIAIPQFTGYFAKARDSERVSALSSMATILKVQVAGDASGATKYNDLANAAATAVGGDGTVDSDIDELTAALAAQGFSLPSENTTDFDYFFAANDKDFVIAACSEETPTNIFSAGSANGIADLDNVCTASVHVPALTSPATTLVTGAGATALVTYTW